MSIKTSIENYIVDDMSSKQINYIEAVQPDDATGELADLYKQIRNDFQLVPPITLFSANADMLAGLWAISRESQLAKGLVSRSDKAAVSSAVSSTNNCSYVLMHISVCCTVLANTIQPRQCSIMTSRILITQKPKAMLNGLLPHYRPKTHYYKEREAIIRGNAIGILDFIIVINFGVLVVLRDQSPDIMFDLIPLYVVPQFILFHLFSLMRLNNLKKVEKA